MRIPLAGSLLFICTPRHFYWAANAALGVWWRHAMTSCKRA